MNDLAQLHEAQARQIVHEYACAVKAGDKYLIAGIRRGNPDLASRFDKVDVGFRQVREQRSAD